MRKNVDQTQNLIASLVNCDLTEMLNQFMQKIVLAALEDAGVFTSGGLVKDKVMPNCRYFTYK